MIITFEQLRAANFEVTITVTTGRPQCRSHNHKAKAGNFFFPTSPRNRAKGWCLCVRSSMWLKARASKQLHETDHGTTCGGNRCDTKDFYLSIALRLKRIIGVLVLFKKTRLQKAIFWPPLYQAAQNFQSSTVL